MLEEAKEGQCGQGTEKHMKRKDKETLYHAGLSQPRWRVWMLFKEKREIFKINWIIFSMSLQR